MKRYAPRAGDVTKTQYDWSRLDRGQVGRYAEYYVKMEFTRFGFDVYTSEVDDKGIDFVIRKDERCHDVQVKSARGMHYIFLTKSKFPLSDNLFAAVVVFLEGEPPRFYLIPRMAWATPDDLLRDREYEGKKSKPEWGINLSKRNLPLLEEFEFEKTVQGL